MKSKKSKEKSCLNPSLVADIDKAQIRLDPHLLSSTMTSLFPWNPFFNFFIDFPVLRLKIWKAT